MNIEINGKTIETDEQGYLRNLDDWSEEFAAKMAEIDGIELFDEHWGLILYFRDFYQETLRSRDEARTCDATRQATWSAFS